MYILIIFITAFFGQIWMTIRCFFKKNILTWFFIVLSITISFSFGLSQINILNDELIDKTILSENDLYKYDIHVSSSEVSTEIRHKYLSLNILVPKSTNGQLLVVDGKEIKLINFENAIFKFLDELSESDRFFINYILFVDENVEMKFILELKQRLIKIGASRLYYATKKVDSNSPFYHNSNQGFGSFLGKDIPYNTLSASKEVGIEILNNGLYFFNGKRIKKGDLTKDMKKYFQKKEVQSFRIYMKENTKFHEYFQVLESSKIVIYDLRNLNSKKDYGISYDNLNRKQKGKQILRKKYRWQVIDIIE